MAKINIKSRQAFDSVGAKVKDRLLKAAQDRELIDASYMTTLIKDWIFDDDEGISGILYKHIYAALRREDFQIQDGEKLNDPAVLLREISRKTGLTLGDTFDKDSIIKALDQQITAHINRALSTQINSVVDPVELKEGLTQTIVAQIEGGGLGAVIANGKAKIATVGNIALSAAFKRLQAKNIRDGHKKLMRRIYQKRFERTHEKVWV